MNRRGFLAALALAPVAGALTAEVVRDGVAQLQAEAERVRFHVHGNPGGNDTWARMYAEEYWRTFEARQHLLLDSIDYPAVFETLQRT